MGVEFEAVRWRRRDPSFPSKFFLSLLLAGSLLGALGGCSGGSGDSSANQPTVVSTKVATSVDPSVQGPGALAIESSMSLVEKQPVSIPVLAQAGTVVYGLDSGGNVALAGNVVDEKAVFSAAGTVLAMGAQVLQGIVPTATREQLQARVKAADGYAALVTAVQSAVLAGKNPLDQAAVQRGFDTVLTSAAGTAVQAQSVQPGTVRALAVAPTHALDVPEPSVLDNTFFRISLANKTIQGAPSFAAAVYFRNTSTLTFNAQLLDDNGLPQAKNGILNGAGPTIFTSQGALPQSVDKSFPGSFSVRLEFNEELTQISYLKALLELPEFLNSACVSGLATSAAKQGVSQLTNITFKLEPDSWALAVLDLAWDDIKSCGVSLLKDSVKTSIKAYFKITQAAGIARYIADTLALVPELPIQDTGVCLSRDHYQISCVSKITVDAFKPMMPFAVQPINVLFLDIKGKKTLEPFGLKIEYSNDGLFELSPSRTTMNSNLNNVEGTGTFTITDPATDTTISKSVTVTNGKLEQTAYTVPTNGVVDVKVVDPASGSEVYRGAAFDIYVADGRFGSFTPIAPGLGALTFHASGVSTSTPQPIRFNGPRDSGSTLSVDGATDYWVGTFIPLQCQAPPDGMNWFWERPCFNVGVVSEQSATKFWFPALGGSLVMQSQFNGGTVRRILDVNWNASDPLLTLSIPTSVLVPSATDTGRPFQRFSGTRVFQLAVTDRTATAISGTFVVTSSSGASPPPQPTVPENAVIPIQSTTSGTWSAQKVSGASVPVLLMNGFDLCWANNTASKYPSLDVIATLTPNEANGRVYSSLEFGDQTGTCSYGRLNF